MSDQQDGGPAFPSPSVQHVDLRGMSLRDWFAGQALAGLLASEGGSDCGFYTAPAAAARAYDIADAMLAARRAP